MWSVDTGLGHAFRRTPGFPQSGRSCNLCQGFSLGREVSSKVFTRLVLARTPALPRGEEVIQFSSIGVPRIAGRKTRPLSSPQLWLRSRFWASLYAQLEGKSPETTDLNRFRGSVFRFPGCGPIVCKRLCKCCSSVTDNARLNMALWVL